MLRSHQDTEVHHLPGNTACSTPGLTDPGVFPPGPPAHGGCRGKYKGGSATTGAAAAAAAANGPSCRSHRSSAQGDWTPQVLPDAPGVAATAIAAVAAVAVTDMVRTVAAFPPQGLPAAQLVGSLLIEELLQLLPVRLPPASILLDMRPLAALLPDGRGDCCCFNGKEVAEHVRLWQGLAAAAAVAAAIGPPCAEGACILLPWWTPQGVSVTLQPKVSTRL